MDDYAVLGYDNAGFIAHVTRGEKWLCESTAKQIRNYYKSVKVVDGNKADELVEQDCKEWIRANCEMKEVLGNS